MDKTCRVCSKTLPLSEFPKDPKYTDGVRWSCLACYNATKRDQLKRHPRPKHPRDLSVLAKHCVACKEIKPASNFYSDPVKPDGLFRVCIDCSRLMARTRGRSLVVQKREQFREQMKSPEFRKHRNELARQSYQRNKAKGYARGRVHLAVKNGKLVRGSCVVCQSPITQAHHEDYSKPLSVIWLCQKHHGERHRLYP